MRSSWSLGIVYIALGGLSVSGIGGRHPLGPVAWVLAALLVAAGALMFTRTRPAFFFALAAGALTAASGVMPYLHHPELALPVPPALSIVVGLYLIFRTAIAAPTFGPPKTRSGFIPRDEEK
jgi:hypothetical protein